VRGEKGTVVLGEKTIPYLGGSVPPDCRGRGKNLGYAKRKRNVRFFWPWKEGTSPLFQVRKGKKGKPSVRKKGREPALPALKKKKKALDSPGKKNERKKTSLLGKKSGLPKE